MKRRDSRDDKTNSECGSTLQGKRIFLHCAVLDARIICLFSSHWAFINQLKVHIVLCDRSERKRQAHTAKRQLHCHVIYFYSLAGDTCNVDGHRIRKRRREGDSTYFSDAYNSQSVCLHTHDSRLNYISMKRKNQVNLNTICFVDSYAAFYSHLHRQSSE